MVHSRSALPKWSAFVGISSLALLMSGVAVAASKENQASAAALLAMRHADETVQAMRGNLNATLGAGGNGAASARALDAALRSQIEIAKLLDSHISKGPLTPGRRGGSGGGGSGGSGGGSGGIDLNGFMAGYIAALIDFEYGINQAIETENYVVIVEEFSSFESYYSEYESWYEEVTTTEEFSSEVIEEWQQEIDTGSNMAVLGDEPDGAEPEALGAEAPDAAAGEEGTGEDVAAADETDGEEADVDEAGDGTDEAMEADEGGDDGNAVEDDSGGEELVDDEGGGDDGTDEGSDDVGGDDGGGDDGGGDDGGDAGGDEPVE
jgi:uncharacterized membrane protein YgcG